MDLQSNFLNSFIKGVGKTTGTLLMLGLASGLWYLSTSQKMLKKNNKKNRMSNETSIKMENIGETSLELSEIPEIFEQDDTIKVENTSDNKFKKMFDKI